MRQVRTLAARAAAGDAKVFITGESGVGKDVVAQYIHAHSTRATKPFIAVNCAAIADTCSKPSSSATPAAASPAPTGIASGASKPRIAAPSFSTKSPR